MVDVIVLPDTTEAQLWNLHKIEESEAVSLAVFEKDVWENLLHKLTTLFIRRLIE